MRWIPVSDRLPKFLNVDQFRVAVLMTFIDESIDGDKFLAVSGGYYVNYTIPACFINNSGWEVKDVIAWHPMPEPYDPKEKA